MPGLEGMDRLWELMHWGRAHSQTWIPLNKGKGPSRGAALKMTVNNRVEESNLLFYSSGPKTTKEALQCEIHVAL